MRIGGRIVVILSMSRIDIVISSQISNSSTRIIPSYSLYICKVSIISSSDLHICTHLLLPSEVCLMTQVFHMCLMMCLCASCTSNKDVSHI